MTKDSIKGIIIGLALVLGMNMAGAAWSNPASAPTGGNPDVPINVGGVIQQKSGGLQANYLISNTQIGIGTIPPAGTALEVTGGITKTTGGLIIETRTAAQGDPASPATGRMWLMVP